jgi:hypothetical protein
MNWFRLHRYPILRYLLLLLLLLIHIIDRVIIQQEIKILQLHLLLRLLLLFVQYLQHPKRLHLLRRLLQYK